jgi:hypothetical protein
VVWSLWLCRNDKVFNDKNCSLLKVIYRCTGILRLWLTLERIEHRDLFMEVCTRLEAMARDTFSLGDLQVLILICISPFFHTRDF